MLVIKCDSCKKIVDRDKPHFSAGAHSSFATYSFCEKCGKPIEAFLTKNGLLKKQATRPGKKRK